MRPETQDVVGKTSHFFLFRAFLNLLFMIQDHFAICLFYLFINPVFNFGPIKKELNQELLQHLIKNILFFINFITAMD